MKKMICLLMTMIMLLSAFGCFDVLAEESTEPIRILLNNKFVECDQAPVLVDNRTLVPMRAILEALGAQVQWDDATQTVTAVKGDKTISLTIGQSSLSVNGNVKTLDVPAQLIGGRTMIPVRAVSEAFDCIVDWNNMFEIVIIIPKNQTPYRVEALRDGEVVATARFNDKGLLAEIEGTYKKALSPLYININGNQYYEFVSGKKVIFNYDSKGRVNLIEQVESDGTVNNKTVRYNADGCISDNYGPLTYAKAANGKVSAKNSFLTFWFNSQSRYTSSNTAGPGYSYDEKGNMIKLSEIMASGGNKVEYQYDDEQRLTVAYVIPPYGDGYKYTYRYIEE